MPDRYSVLEKLIATASDKGYLLLDEVSDTAIDGGLSISDIDWLSRSLALREVKLFDTDEEAKEQLAQEKQDKGGITDYAHIDYEPVYQSIVSEVPELATFIDEVRNIKPAGFGEYTYWIERLKNPDISLEEDHDIRNRLIEVHIRKAVKVGYDFHVKHPETDLEDDISYSCSGLIRTIYNFDPSSEFSTISGIASFGSFRAVQRFAMPLPAPYYPVHIVEASFPVHDEIVALLDQGDFNAAVRYVKGALACDDAKAAQMVNIYAGYIPLEQVDPTVELDESALPYKNNYYNNAERNMADESFIAAESGYDEVEASEIREKLEEVMNDLTEKEKDVICCRFGFIDGKEKTLEEVGSRMGVTRERIRQIESKALKKLRHPTRYKKLRDLL